MLIGLKIIGTGSPAAQPGGGDIRRAKIKKLDLDKLR